MQPAHGDDNKLSERHQGVRTNKHQYGNDFDDDSIDDINNNLGAAAAAADDIVESRNSRFFKLIVNCTFSVYL